MDSQENTSLENEINKLRKELEERKGLFDKMLEYVRSQDQKIEEKEKLIKIFNKDLEEVKEELRFKENELNKIKKLNKPSLKKEVEKRSERINPRVKPSFKKNLDKTVLEMRGKYPESKFSQAQILENALYDYMKKYRIKREDSSEK